MVSKLRVEDLGKRPIVATEPPKQDRQRAQRVGRDMAAGRVPDPPGGVRAERGLLADEGLVGFGTEMAAAHDTRSERGKPCGRSAGDCVAGGNGPAGQSASERGHNQKQQPLEIHRLAALVPEAAPLAVVVDSDCKVDLALGQPIPGAADGVRGNGLAGRVFE